MREGTGKEYERGTGEDMREGLRVGRHTDVLVPLALASTEDADCPLE